ncbi:hypothetical protein HK105_208028 [Polyrhizophydium stewartii]|uniref:KxDL domain-containing protein n=1 Tax=Polyrhizophydium stewartii TaxID=2732419 RepID=A0ABR4MYV9_9FUNG
MSDAGSGSQRSETLVGGLSRLSDEQALAHILEHQAVIRKRLQTTTKALQVFNSFSAARYAENARAIEGYARLLKQTQADLETVFKRVRALKRAVERQHAEEHAEVLNEIGEAPELED